MKALFAYGTLMHPPVMSRVIGRLPPSTPGRLAGYACSRLAKVWYPGISPDASQHVDGLIYWGLSAAELNRLDAYESDQYDRVTVRVERTDQTVDAEAYVVREAELADLTGEPWVLDAYLRGAYGPVRMD